MLARTLSASGLLGSLAALLLAAGASAQVNLIQDFEVLPATGWTGNITPFGGPSMCGGGGISMLRQHNSGVTTGNLGSFAGVSLAGAPCTFRFDYKVCTVASGNVLPAAAPWGQILAQFSNSPSGPWTTCGTILNEAQTGTCITRSFTFTPAAGPVFIQVATTWGGGTNWFNFDNFDIFENAACAGTPAPGNTVATTPVCNSANFVLTLQNPINSPTLNFQWEESTVSASGPFTPIAGATRRRRVENQSADTWYRCGVTCTTSGLSAFSNPLFVPLSTNVFPQDFGTGVINPNCWTNPNLGNNVVVGYNGVSAFGVGTGSAIFQFYNIAATAQIALVSPIVPPTPVGGVVSFDVAGAAFNGGEIDQIVVEQSADNGVTWTAAATLDNSPTGALNPFGLVVAPGAYLPAANEWSTVTLPLAAGTTRVRFRGVSDFGNNVFLDNIGIYPSPPAYHAEVGVGCYDYNTSSFAEAFANGAAAQTALNGNSVTFINAGTTYLAVWNAGGASGFVAPSGGAATLTFADPDDGEVTITPSLAAPIPGGSTPDWTVSVNGILTAGSVANNLADFSPSLAEVGTAAGLAFYTWRDFNLAEAGSGTIRSEEIGNTLYITWNGVEAYPAAPTVNPSTFQFQVDLLTGNVTIVWTTLEGAALTPSVVGMTLAGTSPTPPSRAMSSASPSPFTLGGDISPMALSAVGRPINNGTPPTYTVSNIPEYFPGAGFSGLAIVFGFTPIPGGVDLGPGPFDIGAPGCNGYTTPDVIVIIGLVPFAPVTFPIPWSIPAAPGQLWMQAVSEFLPGTLPNGQNVGGKVTSNALEIYIENF